MATPKNNIPKSETVWVRYKDANGADAFMITGNAQRDTYYLYDISDGVPNKVGKDKSPVDLEKKHCVLERIK